MDRKSHDLMEQVQLGQDVALPICRMAAVCLGDKGSGKTTTIAYLKGHRLARREVETINVYDNAGNIVRTIARRAIDYEDPALRQLAPIAVTRDDVGTTVPHSAHLTEQMHIVDLPGLRGLANAIVARQVLRELEGVVPVFFINFSACMPEGSTVLLTQVRLLQRLFPDLEQMRGSLVVAFTHLRDEHSARIVLDELYASKSPLAEPSAEATYLDFIIEEVETHGERLLVRPLEGDPVVLRQLLAERLPVTATYGLPITQNELNRVLIALETESNSVQWYLKQESFNPPRESLNLIFKVVLELGLEAPQGLYLSLQRKVSRSVETALLTAIREMESGNVTSFRTAMNRLAEMRSLQDHLPPKGQDSIPQHDMSRYLTICCDLRRAAGQHAMISLLRPIQSLLVAPSFTAARVTLAKTVKALSLQMQPKFVEATEQLSEESLQMAIGWILTDKLYVCALL